PRCAGLAPRATRDALALRGDLAARREHDRACALSEIVPGAIDRPAQAPARLTGWLGHGPSAPAPDRRRDPRADQDARRHLQAAEQPGPGEPDDGQGRVLAPEADEPVQPLLLEDLPTVLRGATLWLEGLGGRLRGDTGRSLASAGLVHVAR